MKGPQSNEPVTTEILADNAFFDANKNIGIFGGHVKVSDPRFTLQSERLTVYITKGQNQGTPRVQEGVNTHIATSPETVMVVNQNGQLTTRGPSRTEIRQEPKTDDGEKKEGEKKKEAKPASSPKESATP